MSGRLDPATGDTLVIMVANGAPVSTGNPLPVTGGGGSGGTVTVAGGTVTLGGGSAAIGSVSVSGGTTTIGGTLPPVSKVTPFAGTSSVVATGGTAVTVFAAGALTNAGYIQNPPLEIETLFINGTGAATTVSGGANLALAPGQSIVVPPSTLAWTANAVTTGHKINSEGT